MPKAPKTHEDLRNDIGLSERTALTVAAVLPNLPTDESLIVLTGSTRPCSTGTRHWETDEDIIDGFKRRHDPVCPNSDVYRVAVDGDKPPGVKAKVTPVPHPFQPYHISEWDFIEIESLYPGEYSFEDTDQSTLTDFGTPSPYFSPSYKLAGEWGRMPRLPV